MEELELLKKDWNKKSDDFKDYSEKEIHKMIKQKSVSVTKTLFVTGSIEIVLWAVYGYIDGYFPYTRMSLFGVFFGLVIYFFNKISTGETSISLMKNILNLRKIIFGYAGISFLLIVLVNVIDFKNNTKDFMAGLSDGYNHNNLHTTNAEQMTPELGNYIVFGAALIIVVYLLYVIYKKTYGKILFDLKKNYKELSEIEENLV
ncbi:hypothetical protein SAMN05421664_2452 [Chryseobacterium soldanellicola]|uniref:Uncharacterized protein n=1 Tax=Chryseobacterium soldanellicola TaxID=311333 RepID=A0A1H1DF57_9FLAO|nr:hypothetical protein [Chryseobacterium soldanellicola]SDQ75165.1 hypothetical protein SAMN05421664_2452 [Chryseobacterium soldanellicola]